MASRDDDRFLPALPEPAPETAPEPAPETANDEQPDDSLPLFVYGRLQDELFVGRLLERSMKAEEATLLDFELSVFQATDLPVLLPAPGGRVPGRLYRGLTAEDYRRLDAYQGLGEGLYQRLAVQVVAGGETPEPANTYGPTNRTLGRWSIARAQGRQPM